MLLRRTLRYTFLGLLLLSVLPAFASVDGANATVTCNAYSLSVSASGLVPGTNYSIDYTMLPSSLSGLPITGSIPFNSGKSTTFNGTLTGSFTPLSGSFSFSGTATLAGSTTPITFSPASLTCAPPPIPPCSVQSTNLSNFNGTPIGSGEWVWFNANFTASGIPSTGATISFTNSTISAENGVPFSVAAPNAQIMFSPSATCSSTTFNAMTNTWITTVPVKGDDEIFLTGVAIPVPSSGWPGGNNVSWTGAFSTNSVPGISIDWKWGAAVYSNFTTDYNALAVKAAHQTVCGSHNGDHAGTPEGVTTNNQQWKQFVIGGARGGGGSNWTGSWSSTQSFSPTGGPSCYIYK